MKTLRFLLAGVLLSLCASAQPTMPISPVQGNPADLRIQMQPSGYTSFEIKIGLDCSFYLVGNMVLMDNSQTGIIGSYGSVGGSICQIDTGASQVLSDGYILRIQRFGTVLGSYDVVAHYTEYGGQYTTMTLGQWAAGPPIVAPVITSPMPGSVLPMGGATFTWTAGSPGISSYGLYVGTNPGAANLYNLSSTSSLSAAVTNLPSTGGPVYVTLRWYHPVANGWQSNAFTYTAGMPIAPPQIVSPAPGTIVSGPSLTVSWIDSVTAENTWTQIGTTAGGGELSQYQTMTTAPRR